MSAQSKLSQSSTGERVRKELREVVELLTSAEQIASGLVDLLNHAYEHDHRTKGALAAANTLCCVVRDELYAAEDRCK